MGNRAVITTGKEENNIAIYLHWNGGPESVLAFIETAKNRGYRDPVLDGSYAMARLTGVIHEFFGVGESTSLGIGTVSTVDCDNHDNGVYELGENWTIIDRWGKGHDSIKTPDELGNEDRDKYEGIINTLSK